MRIALLCIPFLFVGCKSDDSTSETGDIDTEDTDTDSDSGIEETGETDTEEPCLAEVIEITPEDGEDDVFYQETMSVAFSEDASSAVFSLTEGDTAMEVPVSLSWGDGNLMATLTPTDELKGSTFYTLSATVCDSSSAATFETSEYGSGVDGGNELLSGKTSVLLFENINFTEPQGLGSLIGQYFDAPLLVGVLGVDNTQIDVVAALGYFDNVDGYKQRINESTWTFGQVDLNEKAFFSGQVDEIDLGYSNISIPVYDFGLSGTFAPDASHFAGAILTGKVDTRNMAPLLGQTDPGYVCSLVAAMGVTCEPCPDAEEYCLSVYGEDIVSTPVSGLTVTEVP